MFVAVFKVLCRIMLLVLVPFAVLAQKKTPIYMGFDDTDISKEVISWKATNTNDYIGCYGFGESEAEWELIVLRSDTAFSFQIRTGEWGPNATSWIHKTQTFNKVAVKNGTFKVGEYTGYFASYNADGKLLRGIVIQTRTNKTFTGAVGAEFGNKEAEAISQYFDGKYPELSYKIVDDAWLKAQPKEELQIMRNEIFARYCMRFQKGGKMHTYFSKQEWYTPQQDNVMHLLTDIEKANLDKIQRIEKAP